LSIQRLLEKHISSICGKHLGLLYACSAAVSLA